MKNHPDQPLIQDSSGTIRFKENKIVHRLLDMCKQNGYGLNEISSDVQCGDLENSDYVQLMQLIGYSVSGYGSLSCVSGTDCERADNQAEKYLETIGKSPILGLEKK